MRLSTDDMIYIEQRASNERKSAGAAYLLWFFLGFLSAHRFYLGKPVSAILQIISYFFVIGFVWWVLDFFLIPSIIEDDLDEKRHRLASHLRYRDYAY